MASWDAYSDDFTPERDTVPSTALPAVSLSPPLIALQVALGHLERAERELTAAKAHYESFKRMVKNKRFLCVVDESGGLKEDE